MPRAQFNETVTLPSGPGGTLIGVSGVSATPFIVNPDGTEGAQANAWTDRTGSVAASLVTDGNGNVAYYLDPGEYNIHVADQHTPPRFVAYTRGFESSPYGSAIVYLFGLATARPAANSVAAGSFYKATDTGVTYQSDGNSLWIPQIGATHGHGSVTFSSSTVSNTVTITHGLGSTPTAIFLTDDANTSATMFAFSSQNLTSTTFDVRGLASATFSGVKTFAWLAVA